MESRFPGSPLNPLTFRTHWKPSFVFKQILAALTSTFQADDEGSIPFTRSTT